MASAELSRRVEKVVGYPPLVDVDVDERQRREFRAALLEADAFEDLPASGRRRSSGRNRTGRSYEPFAMFRTRGLWPRGR